MTTKIVFEMSGEDLATLPRVGERLRLTTAAISHISDGQYMVAWDVEPLGDPDDPPLIGGCRVIRRGDDTYECRVHYRWWATGICPSRRGA